MIALSFLSLFLAPAALAVPWRRSAFHGGCTVPQSAFNLPLNFDALQDPPTFVLMGVGVQNYTCNSEGTFDSVGAVGQMFDVSCLYTTSPSQFDTIQTDAFNVWNNYQGSDPLSGDFAQTMQSQFNLAVIGQHYFVNQDDGPAAVWDLTSSSLFGGNPGAIVFAHKSQTAPSPDGSDNILWVELVKVSGELADTIYRIDTVNGQPASTCNPGDSGSFKYGTKYLMV